MNTSWVPEHMYEGVLSKEGFSNPRCSKHSLG